RELTRLLFRSPSTRYSVSLSVFSVSIVNSDAANYPWHFAASLLTIEAENTDKLALYLGECRERGIPVLPPDINESQLRFTVEPGKGVRFGLTAIKNVGEGAVQSLLDVRKKQGRITSLPGLCEDLDLRLVNKRVFESLTKAGAFDSIVRGQPE